MQQVWGTGQFLGPFVPTTTSTDSGMACVARFERHGASPAAAYAIIRMAAATEVRGLCPAVHAPSLVLHRRDDVLVSPANSRYLAEHLPAARYAELEGVDHAPWVGDSEPFFAEVDQFLSSDHPPLSGPARLLQTSPLVPASTSPPAPRCAFRAAISCSCSLRPGHPAAPGAPDQHGTSDGDGLGRRTTQIRASTHPPRRSTPPGVLASAPLKWRPLHKVTRRYLC